MDCKRTSLHWFFTFPWFLQDDIARISNLVLEHAETIAYLTFAISDDDTGNHFLQGFVRLTHRRTVRTLVNLVGSGIFTVCPTPTSARQAGMDIQMNHHFEEFGDPTTLQYPGIRDDIAGFKKAAAAGSGIAELMTSYPEICSRYPGFVLKAISVS